MGPTRLDENGHDWSHEEALGEFRVPVKNFMVRTSLVHIAVGRGMGTSWDRTNRKHIKKQSHLGTTKKSENKNRNDVIHNIYPSRHPKFIVTGKSGKI